MNEVIEGVINQAAVGSGPGIGAVERLPVEHPLTAARERRGMSRGEYSLWSGIEIQALQRCEWGHSATVPAQIERHLVEREGLAAEAVQAQYRAWKESRRQQLERAGVGKTGA